MAGRPASTASGSLPGPQDVLRRTLENGITLLSRPNFNSPSVVVQGYLRAGSLFDPPDRLGLADFTAGALLRGTRSHDFQQIFESLESVGASLSFNSGMHATGFSGRCLAEDLPLLLRLLNEALREPVFPSGQVEKLRAMLLTGLALRAQDTAEMAALTFDEILYAGHPYAVPEDGFPETIQAIKAQDLADFNRLHYGPSGMVVVIVGGIEPGLALDLAGQIFSDWCNPDQPGGTDLPEVNLLEKTRRRDVHIAGKAQSDLVIGSNGPRRRDAAFMPASLANSILGQFGMMGRIGELLREKAGLAYYAYSSLNSGLGPGSWVINAGVNPANLERAIGMVTGEIRRFTGHGVSGQELSDSQASFIGRLPLSLETNAGVAGALLNVERFGLGLDYYLRYAGLVRQVTADQVHETACRYLVPDRLAVATAGPEAEK